MPRRTGRQTRIPGTERRNRNAAVEAAASKYVEARDERMELSEREAETQTELVAAMDRAHLTTYRCDDSDLIVEVSELRKAKVRKHKDPDADSDA